MTKEKPEQGGSPFLPSRRQFLWATGGVITAATIAGTVIYFNLEEDAGPKPPEQFGPIKIGVNKQIIDKRFEEKQDIEIAISNEERDKIIPFLYVVLNGRSDLVENFFTKSSEEALNAVIAADPNVTKYKQRFLEAFPKKFEMSDSVSRGIISVLKTRVRALDPQKFSDTLFVLVENGADPITLLAEPGISKEDFREIISSVPKKAFSNHLSIVHSLMGSIIGQKGSEDVWEKIGIAIEAGANVNYTPKPPLTNMGTTLHILIANEDFSNSVRLIRMMGDKFDPNIPDMEKKTPLIIAAKTMSTEVVQALLETHKGKIDLNAQDENGRTALHYACAFGRTDMAKALLEAGADPNIRDNQARDCRSYLKLSNDQIREMLASIEISADRDVGATWNALMTSRFEPFGDKDGKALLATKENMDKFESQIKGAVTTRGNRMVSQGLADRGFVEQELAFIEKQKAALQGKSVLSDILKQRGAIGKTLDQFRTR